MQFAGAGYSTGIGAHANSDIQLRDPRRVHVVQRSSRRRRRGDRPGDGPVRGVERHDDAAVPVAGQAPAATAPTPVSVGAGLGDHPATRRDRTPATTTTTTTPTGSSAQPCSARQHRRRRRRSAAIARGADALDRSATIHVGDQHGVELLRGWSTAPRRATGHRRRSTCTLVTNHSQVLSGLATVTAYHYRVRSIDGSGQEGISGDNTFITSSTGGSSTVAVSTLPTTGTPVNGWGPFERDRSNGEAGAGRWLDHADRRHVVHVGARRARRQRRELRGAGGLHVVHCSGRCR